MRGRRGAVLVANPATGRILAVWNPRVAFGQAFPPGSTAKLVTSVAALEESAISPSDLILCRRVPRLLGNAYRCSHPPADEPFTLAAALANSCNYFFAELSQRLSAAALTHWYAAFGFGTPAPVEGILAPSGEIRVGARPRQRALAALGERTITATPAQLLLAYSAVATRGSEYRLQDSSTPLKNPVLLRAVPLRAETLDVIRRGLEECVHSGMCRQAALPGVRVAGKTGTASALDGSGVTHAWFVAYAPAESPEIALVVFLERGTGARDAAPLAGEILKHYFATNHHQP